MPKAQVHEEVINVKLAEILRRDFKIDARAERIIGRRRPDIRCFYNGFVIGIEASYDKKDAEEDAKNRIEQGVVDIALAVWLKEPFMDLPEDLLTDAIKKSKFSVKVFISLGTEGELLSYLEEAVDRRAEPVTGWFEDIELPVIKNIIENSINYIIKEEDVQKIIEEMKNKFDNFVKTLNNLDFDGSIRGELYSKLYQLYGLRVAETSNAEVIYGHAALSILLSTVFYEHVREYYTQLKPVLEAIKEIGPIEGLIEVLEELKKIDYRVAVELTLEILKILRKKPSIGPRVKDLVLLGASIATRKSLLRRDFAGRLYHEITGSLAVRKGFATFYTEVPAAYLLAHLATHSLLEIDKYGLTELEKEQARRIIEEITSIKVGDLACGSGTLLTATYGSLIDIASKLKFYYNLGDIDINNIGQALIENGIYGIDALRYASQITAINLALLGPRISKENIHTIYLGFIPKKGAWLGSLELLDDGKRVGGILAFIEGGMSESVSKTTLEGLEGSFSIPERFDLIIMNPPFTRATGRTKSFGEERGVFGFIGDEDTRKEFLERLRKIRNKIRQDLVDLLLKNQNIFPENIQKILRKEEGLDSYLDIGKAGEGLLFLYLAHKYIKDRGIIAFVLPRNVLMGVSWLLARVLLVTQYHLKYVIVSSDPERGYNFSEGTSLSEVLLIAERKDHHDNEEETLFVNLLRKPATVLEAMVLAESIERNRRGHVIVGRNMAEAYVTRVKREDLIKYIANWNILLNESLFKYFNEMVTKNEIQLGNFSFSIPLATLNSLIIDMGVNRGGDVIEAFNLKVTGNRVDCKLYKEKPRISYVPMICGGGEEIAKKMLVSPNSYVPDSNSPKAIWIKNLKTKFFLPNRIRWTTFHVIALRSTEDAVSNVYFMVKTSLHEKAEKALIAWLNSFWGILTVFAFMEITEEAYTRLNIAQWKILPVLNVSEIKEEKIECLSKCFEKYAQFDFGRLPQQFAKGSRIEFDLDVLKCLSQYPLTSRELEDLKKELINVYRDFAVALSQIARQRI